ncbi:MAG: hypothetical protein RLZZ450_1853 [Pseudomonadota bacterium]
MRREQRTRVDNARPRDPCQIQAHTKAKQKGTTLTKKAKLTPEDSDVSTELTGKTSATLESLKTADAASFDALYVSAQATQHEEVLNLVDSRLLPSVTHEDLKGFLGETRTMVESHVTEAKTLQQELAAAPAAPTAATPASGAPTAGKGVAGEVGAAPTAGVPPTH